MDIKNDIIKANKGEVGGAFLLSWVVINVSLIGGTANAANSGLGLDTLEGALILAVAWLAFGGAHILPIVTWSHIMTGDVTDFEGNWMPNLFKLGAQMIGALLAILLSSEVGGADGLAALDDWAEPDMVLAIDDLWPIITMIAAGSIFWIIHTRCDSAWVSALAVMALATAMNTSGAYDMSMMIADGRTININTMVNWITDGLFVGVGALLANKIDEQL